MSNFAVIQRFLKEKLDEGFVVRLKDKTIFKCRKLIVSTGGLSIPKFGSDGFGYKLARQFGHAVTELDPALVGLKAKEPLLTICKNLSGVSLDSKVTIGKQSFRENVLFTHKGFSGPAILQISLHWQTKGEIVIDFFPDQNMSEYFDRWRREKTKSQVGTLLKTLFPSRFVDGFISHFIGEELLAKKIGEWSKKSENQLNQYVHRFSFLPEETEGYLKAEVTRGGVDVNEISSKTFESKLVPNLYFIGEVLDVAGWLGGYNFQWAWSSGYVAAQSIASKDKP
ncbi:MAG: aminoacetone oxidase family FAD-binding enzyme [Bdellovibrionales bacterium]